MYFIFLIFCIYIYMFLIVKFVYDNFEMICFKQNMYFFDKYENCGLKNYMFIVKFKNRKKFIIIVFISLFQQIKFGIECSNLFNLQYYCFYLKDLFCYYQYCFLDYDCISSYCSLGVYSWCYYGYCYCLGKMKDLIWFLLFEFKCLIQNVMYYL